MEYWKWIWMQPNCQSTHNEDGGGGGGGGCLYQHVQCGNILWEGKCFTAGPRISCFLQTRKLTVIFRTYTSQLGLIPYPVTTQLSNRPTGRIRLYFNNDGETEVVCCKYVLFVKGSPSIRLWEKPHCIALVAVVVVSVVLLVVVVVVVVGEPGVA
jgi:hypothetical protein